MSERTVPRPVVALALLLALTAPAAAARATNRWVDGRGWVHHHTQAHYTYNGMDEHQDSRTQADAARQEWSDDTVLTLNRSTHDPSRSHLIDGYYGDTNWLGLNQPQRSATDGHVLHSHVNINLTYHGDGRSYGNSYERRATACHEIGHSMGLDHRNVSDTTRDCMGTTLYTTTVRQHSIDTLAWFYAAPH